MVPRLQSLARLCGLAALLLVGCASPHPSPPGPSAAYAPPAAAQAWPHGAMVAAANPLAVEAGLKVLREGGSAIDAAVAVQAMLGLVEPQSSGLGGGAFITYFDARTGKVTAYDGRETAPAGARRDMFLGPDGKPLPRLDAVRSGRSTGAPGAIAALGMAHADHGRLPWKALFGEAERTAEAGFAISPRLSEMINSPFPLIATPDLTAYFTRPGGEKLKTGDILKNPAYADTLRRLAQGGPRTLLQGEIARDIAARVQAAPLPGTLTVADMAAYRPHKTPALCRPYRVYVVCVPPPPSSGVGVLQGLALLATTDIDARTPQDPEAWSQFIQASRLMYADRDRYVADPAFVAVPVEGLLDPAYLASRAALIQPKAGPWPTAGKPPGAPPRGPDATAEPGGTSHFVVVDADGNVVSITTTVEAPFGSGRMTRGFILNNQLTDFSFSPDEADGLAAANAVAPGKRPRSSMSPAIVLDRQGRFVAALGSPGGNSIVAYNLKALVGVLDWELGVQEAAALPNIVARGGVVGGETDLLPKAVLEGLAERGIKLAPARGEASGIHGVMVREGRLEGGADPRREGVARAPLISSR